MNLTGGILLGVNIDHIATIRQARHTLYPDPVQAAFLAEQAGADGITVHLREDRRHIQERDIEILVQTVQTHVNLEMAVTDEMIQYALKVKPQHCCLVPEKRAELTTEGGLDVVSQESKIAAAVKELQNNHIQVSLFIDPELKQIEAAQRCKAEAIEIHTGAYAEAKNALAQQTELERIIHAVTLAEEAGFIINAGHGLNYLNVQAISIIPQINELNIGHAIIARAMLTGMTEAVTTMKQLMTEARNNYCCDIHDHE